MKKIWKAFAVAASIALLGSAFTSCKSDDDDSGGSGSSSGTNVGTSFSFSGYKWKLNNGSALVSSDGSVLTVTPASVGVSLQLDDSELAALYSAYPDGFSVTAKVRPNLSTKGVGTAFASNGTGNFGVVSNVTSDGFYGSFVNSNGRMQLGTYQTAKGLQFSSLLTDNTGTIFKKQIDEAYTIRLEVTNDVLSSTINGITCNKSGTTTYSVPDTAKVTRSSTAGSYGILTEFATAYELYSFKVEAADTGKSAIKMITSEADSIATLKENSTAYVFLNDCAYTTKMGSDAITFSVSATSDDGSDVTSEISITNSAESIVSAVIGDVADGIRVITITPAATGTAVVTVSSGTLSRKITVTVEEAATYTDTDYESTTALYPANGATGVFEDDHLVLTFDSTPVLNTGNIEIYDADGNVVDKLSVDGSDANTISDGTNTQLYQLKYFMVQVDGNKVEIIPNCNKLENGKTYHVGISENVISGTINGKTFTGFDPAKGRWTFTTRASKPEVTSAIRVGSSDSANFRTVQGALQAVTQDATITVEKGTYREILLYKKAYNIKIVGDTTTEYGTDVVIQGINCNTFNGASDTRCAFHFKSNADLTLENITIQNAYDRNTMGGTAQSEALYFNSTGHLAAYNSSFLGHQDTLLTRGKNWFYKCYIEGDTDFIWGYADACLLEECKVVQLDTSSDTVPTSGSYVFETRVSSNASTTQTVGKGYVLFNTELVASHPSSYIGRRASAPKTAGSNYYDQFAAINVKVSSGTVSGVYGGSNKAVYIDADSNGNQNVGAKIYGCTGITADSNVDGSGTITETLYTAEYSGRAVILNKHFNKSKAAYEADDTLWNYSALETEFSATADTTSVEASSNKVVYDFSTANPTSTTGLTCTNISWDKSTYAFGNSGATIKVAVTGKCVVTVSYCFAANATIGIGEQKTKDIYTSSGNASAIESISYTNATGAGDVAITYAGKSYLTKIVVEYDDTITAEETGTVNSITISGAKTVAVGASITLTATVDATYSDMKTVTWTSDDTSIATVKDGVVTGVAAGKVTITATSVANPEISDAKTIKVTAAGIQPSDTYVWTASDFYTSGTDVTSTTGTYDNLYIDATNGKFAKNSESLIQCNSGTIVYIPVSSDCKIVIEGYATGYTITGGTSTALTDNGDKTYTYNFVSASDAVTVDGQDGSFAKITFGTDNTYVAKIYRLYNKTWNDADFNTNGSNIQKTTGTYDGLYIDATASTAKFGTNGGTWIQCNNGTIVYIPVVADATITIEGYATGYTITGGTSAALTGNSDKTYTYNFVYSSDAVTVDGQDGYFAKVTMGSDGYWGDIKLEY